MSLAAYNPVGFIPLGFIPLRLHPNDPTTNATVAQKFFENALGLIFESDDEVALLFRVGPNRMMLRVAQPPAFTPAKYTIFGW